MMKIKLAHRGMFVVTNKKEAIKKLNQALELLSDVSSIIQDENKDGKQFDYCTSGELSNCTDRVLELVMKIDNIVYQK